MHALRMLVQLIYASKGGLLRQWFKGIICTWQMTVAVGCLWLFTLGYAYIYIYIYIYIYDCWKKSKFTKWLPPWRKGRIICLRFKSVFDCLTIGIIHETMVVHMTWDWTFFNNYSNHPRMCVLSTLCGNVDKHSPFDIYIYIYIT